MASPRVRRLRRLARNPQAAPAAAAVIPQEAIKEPPKATPKKAVSTKLKSSKSSKKSK